MDILSATLSPFVMKDPFTCRNRKDAGISTQVLTCIKMLTASEAESDVDALQSLQENLANTGGLVEELVVAAAKYDLDDGIVTVLEKRWIENGSVQVG